MQNRIEYVIRPCPLGRLLVAATPKGVCLVGIAERDGQLTQRLLEEFPFAEFDACDAGQLDKWAATIVGYLEGASDRMDVPLDVSGSHFQRRVWAALRRIPRGETRSYSAVARSIGAPRSARAVARACAANPVPILTPCHRVIEQGGGLGGYALGAWRKRRLLELEDAEPGR